MDRAESVAVGLAPPDVGSRSASELRRGAVAMLPLWMGVAPFGAAFAVIARAGGFGVAETMALSLLVFAGSAQLTTVTLYAAGTAAPAIVLTALLLNLRHVLYAVSLTTFLGRRTRPPRPVLAFFLTDESYGVAVKECLAGRGSAGFLFGASLSLYGCFAVATLAGALLGGLLPDPMSIGLDFIFPLSFLALLLPLLRSRRQVVVAGIAGVAALSLGRVFDGGVTVLLATVLAAAGGVALERRGVAA